MSKWGPISALDGWIHIVPCDEQGVILAPHVPSITCECEPVEDDECPNSMLVHQDNERGGYNS